jgi:hypothetical protein
MVAQISGLHRSWNRKPLSGYKIVFVPFANGKPSGKLIGVLTGFVTTRVRRWAVRSALRSTSGACYWSPMTSAMRFGASRPPSARQKIVVGSWISSAPTFAAWLRLGRHHIPSIRVGPSCRCV